ncbi:hypothetical protein SFRURICE_004774 [Spodoptera frugiperda]|nr:hypothetical protein SFRURICE_004774 [Spodoptera frugiperda]
MSSLVARYRLIELEFIYFHVQLIWLWLLRYTTIREICTEFKPVFDLNCVYVSSLVHSSEMYLEVIQLLNLLITRQLPCIGLEITAPEAPVNPLSSPQLSLNKELHNSTRAFYLHHCSLMYPLLKASQRPLRGENNPMTSLALGRREQVSDSY